VGASPASGIALHVFHEVGQSLQVIVLGSVCLGKLGLAVIEDGFFHKYRLPSNSCWSGISRFW
jgi:hypothetical protein